MYGSSRVVRWWHFVRSGIGNPDHARCRRGLQGSLLEGPMVKILRAFSMMKVLRTFCLARSQWWRHRVTPFRVHCFLWIIATNFTKLHKPHTSREATTKFLKASSKLKLRDYPQTGSLVQGYSSCNGGPVCAMVVMLGLLDPCRRVCLMSGDETNTCLWALTQTSRQRKPASRRLGVSTVMIPIEQLLHGDDRDEPFWTTCFMVEEGLFFFLWFGRYPRGKFVCSGYNFSVWSITLFDEFIEASRATLSNVPTAKPLESDI